MRTAATTAALFLSLAASLAAQDAPGTRYRVEPNLDAYPQATPKEALQSVVKAIDGQQFDYLLAQLADPQFVDARVKALAGGFPELVRETRTRLGEDPSAVRDLRRFAGDGEVEEAGETATVRLKDVKNRAVFLKKVKERWYLENRQK